MDPKAEVARLRQVSAVRRKRRYSRSRLDRYRFELLSLRQSGARAVELQLWLRERNIHVALSTVTRWLARHGH